MSENPRKAIREARAARLRVIDGPPRTVKVYAASEALRATLRHADRTGFRAQLDQPVEWPNDSFTARRIADGSVLTDAPATSEPPEPDPCQNPREHAAACKLKAAPLATPEPQPSEPEPQPSEPEPQPQPAD
jgi:hypothetical protein